MAHAISIYLIGDAQRAEFRDVPPALRSTSRVVCFNSLSAAIAATTPPDLCVLLQSTPGEYASRDLEAALARWPLSRFVAVVGPLGEGEPRSGAPWPGQFRVYWHAFAAWWSVQMRRVGRGELAAWQRPLTSREEDLALQATSHAVEPAQGAIGVIAVRSPEAARLLVDALQLAGWSARRRSLEIAGATEPPQAIVWDDDDPDGQWRERYAALRAAWPKTPIVALLNFPRFEDRVFVAAASLPYATAAIVAKPFELDTLLATLEAVLGGSPVRPS